MVRRTPDRALEQMTDAVLEDRGARASHTPYRGPAEAGWASPFWSYRILVPSLMNQGRPSSAKYREAV